MMTKSEDEILPVSTPTSSFPPPTNEKSRNHALRQELTVFLGEFIGTFMFLFLAFSGTQIAANALPVPSNTDMSSPPEVSKLLYISFAFGIGLAINVAIFADISGGMFNPAVSFGLALHRALPWHRAAHSILAQLIGSIATSAFVSALLPGPLPVSTTIDPRINVARSLFLETFLTAQLVLTIILTPATSAKPAYIGMALFVGEICGVYWTGGSLNPARTFGPAVVTGIWKGYQWIYWLGPAMGAALAAGVAWVLRVVEGGRR